MLAKLVEAVEVPLSPHGEQAEELALVVERVGPACRKFREDRQSLTGDLGVAVSARNAPAVFVLIAGDHSLLGWPAVERHHGEVDTDESEPELFEEVADGVDGAPVSDRGDDAVADEGDGKQHDHDLEELPPCSSIVGGVDGLV